MRLTWVLAGGGSEGDQLADEVASTRLERIPHVLQVPWAASRQCLLQRGLRVRRRPTRLQAATGTAWNPFSGLAKFQGKDVLGSDRCGSIHLDWQGTGLEL